MRWTSRPEWPPILVAAFAGALAVPFVPFINAMLRRLLVFVPTPLFYPLGIAMALVVTVVTWRTMFAGFIQCTENGIVLYRYERTIHIPWTKLDNVDEQKQTNGAWKARFTTTAGKIHLLGFQRLPRADFQRMRRRITDPVLSLPVADRAAAATQALEDNDRDDLVLTILRVYAVLLGLVAMILSWIL